MSREERVRRLVKEVVAEFNESLERPIDLAAGPEAPLFGRDGSLDSLALVSFIAAVEQALADEFEQDVTLADARAFSRSNSPFRTLGSLVQYIDEVLGAHG